MKTKIHAIAGTIGFLTILVFWTSTVYSELFGSFETVANVKTMILKGMFILIPAMIVVGASGMNLGRKRKDAITGCQKEKAYAVYCRQRACSVTAHRVLPAVESLSQGNSMRFSMVYNCWNWPPGRQTSC